MDATQIAIRILQDEELFLHLSDVIHTTARAAVEDQLYIQSQQWVETAPLLTEGYTRLLPRVERHEPFAMEDLCWFDPNHIVLYGGAAMNAFYLSAKQNDGNPAHQTAYAEIAAKMREINVPPTSDIDATWWPVVHPFIYNTNTSNVRFNKLMLPTIHSPIFDGISDAYQQHLKRNLGIFVERFGDKILTLLELKDGTITVDVTWGSNTYVGVFTIKGNLIINGVNVNLLDVSIHDGANSQNPFQNKLNLKEKNIAYVSDVRKIQIGTHTIQVPSIQHFTEQQMFAIQNIVTGFWKQKERHKDLEMDSKNRSKIEKCHLRLLFSKYLMMKCFLPTVGSYSVNTTGRHKIIVTEKNISEDRRKAHQANFLPRIAILLREVPYIMSHVNKIYTFLTDSNEGIVSCPYDSLDRCGINKKSLKLVGLCGSKKMLNPAHCPPRGGTRKRKGSKVVRTRRR